MLKRDPHSPKSTLPDSLLRHWAYTDFTSSPFFSKFSKQTSTLLNLLPAIWCFRFNFSYTFHSLNGLIFLCPRDRRSGGLLFLSFLSLILSFCPPPWNFNLANNFLTVSARAFIFHMHIPCDKTFTFLQLFLTLWPWPSCRTVALRPYKVVMGDRRATVPYMQKTFDLRRRFFVARFDLNFSKYLHCI